ncbi:MAG: AMP-binding protein [Desulfomonile tiedjei]|nr:AMP-binding protein [Desulfomonile tiedjei]
MDKTPLESWIAAKIFRDTFAGELSPADVKRYQLEKLRDTIEYARARSPFYRRDLSEVTTKSLSRLEDLQQFPFTTPGDLERRGPEFLCVSQSEIERVVTLQAAERATKPQRLYFTESDLELAIDFFHHGLSTFVRPGDKVLILMRGDKPGSVGDLLVRALERIDATGIVRGPVLDPRDTLRDILKREIDIMVGVPAQVLSLVDHRDGRSLPPGRVKSVVLTSEKGLPSAVQRLRDAWGCDVFHHFGTAEMCPGAGVDCHAHVGHHVREADLYLEIVDPASGKPHPPDTWGELVFTTLTRRGMPLIRYRTGLGARFLTELCPCGTLLRRLETMPQP